ncbi:hypothetical protein [Aequorivita echinoideorum]|uniref:DUF4468 domain-containing protein n=1 Tax=Aequorivita echinoideorum TaxID=1549647 RepID=A0ABS5S987_9FLAO|nr:hypothetical protein [Aequorivita echinoideorum]MBT0608907.1 hypothetical protein [Aequorivita echinoideorum]
MKKTFLLLLMLYSFFAISQNDEAYVDEQIAQRVAQFKMGNISDYIIRKDFCEGNIQMFKMPDGKMCSSASTYYSVYVFWKENEKLQVEKIDNCGSFEVLSVSDTKFFDKALEMKSKLENEEVKPYKPKNQEAKPTGNMQVQDCRKEFKFHLGNSDFEKSFKEYDLGNNSTYENVNSEYNNALPLVKLDRNISEIIETLESEGKFFRNKK